MHKKKEKEQGKKRERLEEMPGERLELQGLLYKIRY